MANQVNKAVAYDDAVYRARQKLPLAASTAGANGTFGKYIAMGNEVLYGAGAVQVVAGTSTYTTTDTTTAGTATNTTTAATLITPYRVSGTSTTTGLTFVLSVARPGFTTLTGTSGSVGIPLSSGDTIYMVNGTDTTATSLPLWEIGFQPNSQ